MSRVYGLGLVGDERKHGIGLYRDRMGIICSISPTDHQ